MTAVAAPAAERVRPLPFTVLATTEARRLITHPAMIFGWLMLAFMFTVNAVGDSDSISAFDMITTGVTFYPGLFCVLAGHLVATRDARAGTTELLTSTPVPRQQRVAALMLAAAVPALVALALNVVFRQYFVWQDAFVEVPGPAHVLQGPVTVLGGSLLGIMLGLWLPHLTTPVLTMVVLVAGSIILGNDPEASLFAPLVSWVNWGPFDGEAWYALEAGDPGSHVVYLLGLCGLAATACLLRAGTRRGLLVALGFACLAVTAVAGWAQLP